MKVHERSFWCETCGAKEEMDTSKLKEHLATAHGITGKITGSKKGRMFLDFEGGYTNIFDIVLAGNVKVTEVDSGKTV